jgi:outer membrane protein assembly factor BamB
MSCRFRDRWLLALLVLVVALGGAPADNWPQWRGANQDGICTETGLVTEWGPTKNVAWKLSLPGWSGATPVVWGDRIFLTSEDGKDVVLICVSTQGKQLWKRKFGTGLGRYMRGEGNNASPSPSTDGRLVFAYAGTGDFAAFDFEGKEAWRFNAQERYGKFRIWHGMHVTPLLHGDRLYVSLLHSGGWWIIALDKATGKEVWKVERKTDATDENEQSYASPIVWHKGKEEYLVIHGNDYATAHRLKDGQEIWRLGDLNDKDRYNRYLRFVATPAASPDLIVVPTAKGGPVVGVKPSARGMITAGSAGELWRMPRGTPDVPSPLIHGGMVYLCGETGVITCLDAKTGKEHYKKRIHESRYRASPVFADGKIYLAARDGTVTVVKVGPRLEVLAVNKLPDQVTASPAIANGVIYLRGFKALYAVRSGGSSGQ